MNKLYKKLEADLIDRLLKERTKPKNAEYSKKTDELIKLYFKEKRNQVLNHMLYDMQLTEFNGIKKILN